MSQLPQPKISLVLTGRNDNYGGDFRSRLQKCISNAYEQLQKAGIGSEIIFVNYNPVSENPPIEDFINWPSSTDKVKVRLITVPNEVHQQLVADGARRPVPVLEYLGKNAGIRRSCGEFVLSMNPDIILPQNLVSRFHHLDVGNFYRADRIDFSGDLDVEYQMKRVCLKGQDYELTSLELLSQLRSKNKWVNAWRYFTPKIEGLLNFVSSPVYYNSAEYRFHCNGAGDFMLMTRDSWFKLRAHHEHRPISLHVDGLMVVQAAISGLNEVVFQDPIFHQEHERRYDAKTENPLHKEAFDFFVAETAEMMKTGHPQPYNTTDWGLVNFDLPEMNL